MNYEIQSQDGGVLVLMKGELTFNDHPTIKKMLTELSSGSHKSWTFDLSALDSIDSAGIGMMLIAKDEGEKVNARLSLRAPSGNVRKVLELTKIGDMIAIQ